MSFQPRLSMWNRCHARSADAIERGSVPIAIPDAGQWRSTMVIDGHDTRAAATFGARAAHDERDMMSGVLEGDMLPF